MGTFSRAPRRSHVVRALKLGAGEIGLVRPARALPAALCASAMSCAAGQPHRTWCERMRGICNPSMRGSLNRCLLGHPIAVIANRDT